MKLDRSQLVDRGELTSNIQVATHQVVKSSPALLSMIMNRIVSFTPSFSQVIFLIMVITIIAMECEIIVQFVAGVISM